MKTDFVSDFFLHGLQNDTFLQSLFNSLPIGALIVDNNGVVVYCNEAQARLDDMPVEFIVGKMETELYGPYVGPGIIRSCQLTGKPILGYVCQYRTVRGKIINGAYWVYPLYKNGEIVASLCLTQILANKTPLFSADGKIGANILQSVTESSFRAEEEKQKNASEPVHIVGGNSAFRRMLSVAETTASSPSPVMIFGETGSGKEMIVKAIRAASNRYDKPYLAVNCSAIPATLLESILFGSTKGSFTDATDRPGLFEEANGGIIYLDEIDSMPLELQPKLLRVLQDMRIRRLGATMERSINVKVISSIGMSPEALLDSGRLRPDLFYRLAVILLQIPPLRERKDDLKDLITHFMSKYNAVLKKNVTGMDNTVTNLFHDYDWPGNVRELEHIIAGAINLTAWESTLHMHHVPEHLRIFIQRQRTELSDFTQTVWHNTPAHDFFSLNDKNFNASTEGGQLRVVLRKTSGHVSNAAKLLGISRQLMAYKMKKYAISRKDFTPFTDTALLKNHNQKRGTLPI